MLNSITEWMNGPYAGKTMLVLRMAFFILFIITSLVVCFGREIRKKKGPNGFLLLSVLTSLALAALFAYQCSWQLFGTQKVEFMRFIRRHNQRASVDIRRGSILDRNGALLAVDDPAVSSPAHRRYPLGPAAAHVVGYYDPRYGITGIEKAADITLTGIGTSAKEELGRLSRSLVDSKPLEGGDVKLTIDARLQRKAYELMGNRRGAVVALNPSNGEILALVSSPSFDPASPGGFYGDNEAAPFLNRPLQGRYPAGSTFKVAMTMMAAELRIARQYNCPPDGFRAAKDAQPIRDVEYYSYKRSGATWKGFGKIGLKDALVHSSNVYFAQLAQDISAKSFNAYVSQFGIVTQQVVFASSGGEIRMQAGQIPEVTDADKKMRSQLAIGQGKMAVSPLHVAMWTSAVAGGGFLNLPHLDLVREGGFPQAAKVVSSATASNVQAMMREVVRRGTGKNADIPGVGLCGKTGTAQVPNGADHSWFTCFTTETSPRLVVTVLVEHGGFGSSAALPVAKGVVEEAAKLGIIRTKGGTK